MKSSKKTFQQQDYVESPFSPTYDNQQFLKFCLVFFLIGSILNLCFGIYTLNGGYIVNGILLGGVSVGIWQERRIASVKMKA